MNPYTGKTFDMIIVDELKTPYVANAKRTLDTSYKCDVCWYTWPHTTSGWHNCNRVIRGYNHES